jgi:hypothetical protein
MIGSRDLGKALRLSAVGFVTTGTHDGCVELRRFHRGGIVGMPALGTVAGLARDNHMPALLLLIDDVGMTCLARIVARKDNRPGGDLRNRSAPIVPVLAKTPRNNSGTQDDEGNHAYDHDGSKADEMFYVLKQFLFPYLTSGAAYAQQCVVILDTSLYLGKR